MTEQETPYQRVLNEPVDVLVRESDGVLHVRSGLLVRTSKDVITEGFYQQDAVQELVAALRAIMDDERDQDGITGTTRLLVDAVLAKYKYDTAPYVEGSDYDTDGK